LTKTLSPTLKSGAGEHCVMGIRTLTIFILFYFILFYFLFFLILLFFFFTLFSWKDNEEGM